MFINLLAMILDIVQAKLHFFAPLSEVVDVFDRFAYGVKWYETSYN